MSSSCAHVFVLTLRDFSIFLSLLSIFSLITVFPPSHQLHLPRCGGQIPCALQLMRTLTPLPNTTLSQFQRDEPLLEVKAIWYLSLVSWVDRTYTCARDTCILGSHREQTKSRVQRLGSNTLAVAEGPPRTASTFRDGLALPSFIVKFRNESPLGAQLALCCSSNWRVLKSAASCMAPQTTSRARAAESVPGHEGLQKCSGSSY